MDFAFDKEVEELAEDDFGSGLELEFAGVALDGCGGGVIVVADDGFDVGLQVGDGDELVYDGFLLEGVDEAGKEDFDGVYLAVVEGFDHELDCWADFVELGFIGNGEIGDELAARAGDGLGAFAANANVGGGVFRDVCDEAEDIGDEGAAEAFVRRNKEDAAALDGAGSEEGVERGFGLGEAVLAVELQEHFGHELGVGAAMESEVLSALHFGSRDQLHGAGDLGRVFDGLDTATNVSKIGHGKKLTMHNAQCTMHNLE